MQASPTDCLRCHDVRIPGKSQTVLPCHELLTKAAMALPNAGLNDSLSGGAAHGVGLKQRNT